MLTERGLPCGAGAREPAGQYRTHERCEFDPWVRKILWRRKWQPTPVFLPGEFHEQRTLASYSPWGSRRLRYDWSDLACRYWEMKTLTEITGATVFFRERGSEIYTLRESKLIGLKCQAPFCSQEMQRYSEARGQRLPQKTGFKSQFLAVVWLWENHLTIYTE